MVAAYQSFASNSNDLGNNIVVTKPSGTVDGDLLIAIGSTTNGAGSPVSAPAGWTLDPNTISGSSRLWTKVASGEGASYTFTPSPASTGKVTIVRVTGADTANPFDVVSSAGVVSATTAVLPSVTPSGAGRLLLQVVQEIGAGSTWTPPGTTTERFDAVDAGLGYSTAGGDETVGAAATGTRTWTTAGTTNKAGYMLAINPSQAMEVLDHSVAVAGTGGTVTITKPAGTVEGDLLVAHHLTSIATTSEGSSGWTELDVQTNNSSLWYKIAGPSEPADYTFTAASNLANHRISMVRISGVDTSAPFDDVQHQQNTGATPLSPAVTAVGTGNLLVCGVGTYSGNPTATVPTGMSSEYNDNSTSFLHAAASLPVGAGSTGTKQWTLSASQPTGTWSMALNPASQVPSANPAKVHARYRTNATFVVPAGVTQITVECEGGGGPGGTGSATSRGGGGGGGAYASSVLTVTPGSSHSVVVAATSSGASNGNLSSFGTGPLVRGAGGTRGTNGGLGAGAGGAGGTVANSIGTTRTAGGNGVNGGAGGAGASGGNVVGGAGGTSGADIAGHVPGGGGGGGAILSGAGGTGAAGEVHVSWDIVDAEGEGLVSRQMDLVPVPFSVVGEGLASHTQQAVVAKTSSLVGEGLTSRALNITQPRSLIGEGLTSSTKVTVASQFLNVTGEGLVSRGALIITRSLPVVGEGLVSSTKATTAVKSFNLVGEGLVTEAHPVLAARNFDLVGEGLTSRQLSIAETKNLVGEGLVTATQAVVAVKTFSLVGEGLTSRTVSVVLSRNVTGEGLVTELHPLIANRIFDLVGEGLVLMSGSGGSTICLPIDDLPDSGGGGTTVIRPIFVIED